MESVKGGIFLPVNRIRVRFAPSPTGSLHVGGARTALFNWLFVRHHGGTFILRIEDTDLERSTEESARAITEALRWLGLDWDEGPYFQSTRLALYREEAQRLLEAGAAYWCYCTPDELEAMREEFRRAGRPPRYPGRCRDLDACRRQELAAEGRRPVVRLKVPSEGVTVVEDLVRGRVTFENAVLDDFILVKSDGMPTYNFACVVDDAAMEISHVVRAEEHLSNTPKQILLYQALGYRLPVFAHVPMILAPDRSKLSKRHGATSVEEFRDQGYLPEALINYLALLGWSPEDGVEIRPREEIVRLFSLERVSRTAAIYDVKKLTWMNGHYLREGDLDRITGLAISFLERAGLLPSAPAGLPARASPSTLILSGASYEYIRRVVGSVRDRVKTLAELADAASYFFTDDFEYEEKGLRKYLARPGVASLLGKARERLAAADPFTVEATEAAYRELIDQLGISGGELIHPSRVALTGRTVGPGLFDIIALLGKDKCLERLDRAIARARQLEKEGEGVLPSQIQ